MRRGELEAKHYSEGEKELTTKNWASQGLFTLIDQSRRITTQEFNASGQGSGSCQEADQTLIKTKPQTIDWWTRTWFCGAQNRERSDSDNLIIMRMEGLKREAISFQNLVYRFMLCPILQLIMVLIRSF